MPQVTSLTQSPTATVERTASSAQPLPQATWPDQVQEAGLKRRLVQAGLALRQPGVGWVARRLLYEWKRRSGWLAWRMPKSSWQQQPLAKALADPQLAQPQRWHDVWRARDVPFLFGPRGRDQWRQRLADIDAISGTCSVVDEAESLKSGQWPLFNTHWLELGETPDWNVDPLDGRRLSTEQHWSKIDDFAGGDIKLVWELSRFRFAFTLVRAYWRTGDEDLPELFWQLVESWAAANPPHHGSQWKCGQEATLRAMSWLFAWHAFADCEATTPQRSAQMAQLLAFTGKRVEGNLAYALRQRSNHSISEAAGLFTLGVMLPELRSAERWRQVGSRWLERLAAELIYNDGSWAQPSFNYHRFSLQVLLWCIRLGLLNNHPLSDLLLQRVSTSLELLRQLQDETTGWLPNYGQNDGSEVLPLTNCHHRDFRPLIQSGRAVLGEPAAYEAGPWDEAVFWLGGQHADSEEPPRQPANLAAPDGGHYVLRGESGFAYLRCGPARHRPSQADQLHCDIWWRGENIAIDPGTYSYNAAPPWNNPLAQTAAHNTLTSRGQGQIQRVSRFLWLPWCGGEVVSTQQGDGLSVWQGRFCGVADDAPYQHDRTLLQLGPEHWLVLDHTACDEPTEFRLHWLLNDYDYHWDHDTLQLETPAGRYDVTSGGIHQRPSYSLTRACQTSPVGWQATDYHRREPAISLVATLQASRAAFWTLFGPPEVEVVAEGDSMELRHPLWTATVHLASSSAPHLVEAVELVGDSFNTRLKLASHQVQT